MATPKLLIIHKNLQGQVDGIDYVDMIKIPYNFVKLRKLLTENIQKFKELTTSTEFCKYFNQEEVRWMQQIVSNVEELNQEFLKEPYYLKREE